MVLAALSQMIIRSGPYRIYFLSHEPNEPAHIHVDRDNLLAKLWLNPVALACNTGFSPKDFNVLQAMIKEHQTQFTETWHGYFGAKRR